MSFWQGLRLSQASAGFYLSAAQVFRKHCGKRYSLGELSSFFVKIRNCRLQTLSVWKSLKLVFWERVNVSQSNTNRGEKSHDCGFSKFIYLSNNGRNHKVKLSLDMQKSFRRHKVSADVSHCRYHRLTRVNWFLLKHINSFANKALFSPLCSTSLLKTQWEKEKLHVSSNFSFSSFVFYNYGELSFFYRKLVTVVCKGFQFGRV